MGREGFRFPTTLRNLLPRTPARTPFPLYLDTVSLVWAILAFESWDLLHGTLDPNISTSLRLAFYGTDFLLAATSFTLYTVLARFWADLAFAARQGAGASRPMGGGDEYRWGPCRLARLLHGGPAP